MRDDFRNTFKLATMTAAALAGLPASAAEVAGFELYGYTRGGFYSSPAGTPRGGYSLGGDAQKFRLGNEGDQGIEFGIGKTIDVGDGMKAGAYYMPTVWNGSTGTDEAYGKMSGLSFAPEATFWAGQRRLRLQDVHIVDKFFADYGDNLGAGVVGLKLGSLDLGIGLFSSGSLGNHNGSPNNARRANVDVSGISTGAGGDLRVTATAVTGDFLYGGKGLGLSLVHNQKDFVMAGLKNSLFLQVANGHAGLNGQFYNLGDNGADAPGAKSWRIVESVNWQSGPLGGQALVAYQSSKADGGPTDGVNTKDFSLGGRVSYALGKNFKLLGEAGTTSRKIDGQEGQRLSKLTFAPALTLGPDFWSRPELRLYVTRVNWNNAAAAANASSFGAGGRTSNTLFGAQIEAWW